MPTDTVNVSVRRVRKCGTPHLFFYNDDGKRYWLECYAKVGQHSDASKEFMRLDCVPASWDDPDVKALVAEWNGQPGGGKAHLVTRLPQPRGMRYAGH